MNKKSFFRLISCLMVCIMSFYSVSFVANAGVSSNLTRVIDAISEFEPLFLDAYDNYPNTERTNILHLDNGEEAELIEFFYDEEPYGYAIMKNDIILEYSLCASPYYNYINQGYSSFGYYYSYYTVDIGEENISFTFDGTIITEEVDFPMTRGTIPGVSPQLQNSSNCIVCALANIMWYWRSHNFSLIPSSFIKIKANLSSRFNSLDGGYANNNVPTVASGYLRSLSTNYRCTSSVYWSPSISRVKTEIDAGYPCMVGYAAHANSPYGSQEGHMAMCFGYLYKNGNYYLELADGHQTSKRTVIWNTSYNDCVIKVRPYHYTNGGTTQSI